jgi:RNA polymerase sigma-70 factor (ECF subfamily)
MDLVIESESRSMSLEALYREQGDRLWRSLYAYCGDREIAGDSVAEAFAQALSRGGAIHDPSAWIWRAAFRIAAGALKERGRRTFVIPDATVDPPDGPSAAIEALSRLSQGQRAAIVLHYFADLPIGDVARLMGTTSPAVKMHLMRGRRALRGILEIEHG